MAASFSQPWDLRCALCLHRLHARVQNPKTGSTAALVSFAVRVHLFMHLPACKEQGAQNVSSWRMARPRPTLAMQASWANKAWSLPLTDSLVHETVPSGQWYVLASKEGMHVSYQERVQA